MVCAFDFPQLEKEEQAKAKKTKKKQEAAGVKAAGAVEYRPWNRETDLLVSTH